MILRYLLFVLVFLNTDLEGAKTKPGNWNTNPLKSYFKQVEKEKGWTLFGTGSCNLQETPELELFFWAPQKLTLSEARKWYVTETQKVISLYQLGQKKSQKPFSIGCLNYTVAFFNSKNDLSEHEFVERISKLKGQILYKNYNHKTKRYEMTHEEPYEEALRIVQGECECNNVNEVDFPTKKAAKCCYQPPSQDAVLKEMDEAMFQKRGIK